MKDTGIDKASLREIETDSPIFKGFQSIRKLFWKYLNLLGVPFNDPCCPTASTATGGSGYLVYTALLTQTGANPPSVTELENTIGDIVWTRSNVGFYLGTLANSFPEEKTWTYIEQTDNMSNTGKLTLHQDNDDRVYIDTYDATGTLADGKMTFTSIEIRVYP